ncbi:MAG TPA: DnaJ domain-containing protein [Coxiellaceae bacterium]|nr:DnaJ domain-containing protein [Coxiellaceae bacterium]
MGFTLQLVISSKNQSDDFDVNVVYAEKNYKVPLSQFLQFSTQVKLNFFADIDSLEVRYDEKILELPQNIKNNIKLYLTEYHKLLNISRSFTCHQFATYLSCGKYSEPLSLNFNYNTSNQKYLHAGDFITLSSADKCTIQTVHSAIYLGDGLYFSKSGQRIPNICTLDTMINEWHCDFVFIASNHVEINNSSVTVQFSLYENFYQRKFNSEGLCYEILGLDCTTFCSLTQAEIANAIRKSLLPFHPDKDGNLKAKSKFELISCIGEILKNPKTRSGYHVSLLSGYDWTLAKILNIDNATETKSIVAYYDAALDLLSDLNKINLIKKIKNESLYQRALLTMSEVHNEHPKTNSDTLILSITNDYATLGGASFHPAFLEYDGNKRPLEYNPIFDVNPGDVARLKIFYDDVPVIIHFDTVDELKVSTLLKTLQPDLISFDDILVGMTLFNGLTHSNNYFVPLGGNFYLFLSPPDTQKRFSLINHATLSLNEHFKRGYQLGSHPAGFYIESFHQQNELKQWLLLRDKSLFTKITGVSFSENTLEYNYINVFDYCRSGNTILLIKNNRVVHTALYLGNNIFMTDCFNNQIRILNLLMLIESLEWDYACAVRKIEKAHGNVVKIEIQPCYNYIQNSLHSAILSATPPLYKILGIPFHAGHLSRITPQIVTDCYQQKFVEIQDSKQRFILCEIYKLMMNDNFRIQYTSAFLFKGNIKNSQRILAHIEILYKLERNRQANIIISAIGALLPKWETSFLDDCHIDEVVSGETAYTNIIFIDKNKNKCDPIKISDTIESIYKKLLTPNGKLDFQLYILPLCEITLRNFLISEENNNTPPNFKTYRDQCARYADPSRLFNTARKTSYEEVVGYTPSPR